MASKTLYAPIVNDYEPAFVVKSTSEKQGSEENTLKVYFSHSGLTDPDIDKSELSVHIRITKKDGTSVLNVVDGYKVGTEDDVMTNCHRCRATGIILNAKPVQDLSKGENSWYVLIKDSDLASVEIKDKSKSGESTYRGWIPGYGYKIQLRLSTEKFTISDIQQQNWLYNNANNFSEWSTICYTKPIGTMKIIAQGFNDNREWSYNDRNFSGLFQGTIENIYQEEFYDFYRVQLYSSTAEYQILELLDDSEDLYKSETSNTAFKYEFKTELTDLGSDPSKPGTRIPGHYVIKLYYITENQFSETIDFTFDYIEREIDQINLMIQTPDDDGTIHQFGIEKDGNFFMGPEEEEGRISLNLISTIVTEHPSNPEEMPFGFYSNDYTPGDIEGNICIKRSDQFSNFTVWEEIVYDFVFRPSLDPSDGDIYQLTEGDHSTYTYKYHTPIYYDYTIESGVWYKYAVQKVFADGTKGALQKMEKPIRRVFDHSYLVGENQQQLKLKFNNTIGGLSTTVLDSKMETIGSVYPFISRNAATKYQTFDINGMISFHMDENKTFFKNGIKDLYDAKFFREYNDILKLDKYNFNDITYEKEFRRKVYEFLINGKIKLYKSATEGNMLIRITDSRLTPEMGLNKLIYSFSGTATEIDDNTMKNYLKYGIYYPGTYRTTPPVNNLKAGVNQDHYHIHYYETEETPTFGQEEE